MKIVLPIILLLCGCATVAQSPSVTSQWKTANPVERGKILLGDNDMGGLKTIDRAVWKDSKENADSLLGSPDQIWRADEKELWFYNVLLMTLPTNAYFTLTIDTSGKVSDTGMIAWDPRAGRNPTENMKRIK